MIPVPNRADRRDSPTRRRSWAIAVAATLAVTLAGCGDDADSAPDEMTNEATSTDTPATPPAGDDMSTDDDMSATAPPTTDATPPPSDAKPPATAAAAPGVYRDYSPESVAEAGYERTILFFHAGWCPECRAFEEELTSTDLPAGLQILKVDYDTADDLKSQHDVTIQTTFVEVDDDGNQLASWVGYEKDRSIDTVLDGLG